MARLCHVLLLLGSLAAVATTATLNAATPSPTYAPMPSACTGPESGRGGVNCTHRPATIPVHTGAPTFVSAVKNGKRYLAGSGNDTFHVAHLYSETDDLYEMGFALGQMFPAEVKGMLNTIEPWLAELLQNSAAWLPKWLADLVVKYGLPIAIDLVYDITEQYMPEDYKREWQGIADGANCSVQEVRRVALFPQLSKAACTIFIAHDKASPSGGVHQLRALDFAPLSYVSDFASLVVYHYKTKPQLANFGWVSMTGVLTGMNDKPMSAGEKDWGGPETLLPYGLPWMMMMRRSLELDNVSAVTEYLTKHDRANATAPNTVAIHLGYGDQQTNTIKGYEVGFNHSKVFDWNTHRVSKTHPDFDGVVYFSKNDPAHTMCPADMISAQYGAIDAEWLAMYYSPNDKTGDTQVVGFDLENMKVWVANSRKSTTPIVDSEPLCAYYRQRTVLDMRALFTEANSTNRAVTSL